MRQEKNTEGPGPETQRHFVFSRLRPDRWRGALLPFFLVLYGLGRAATDFLRGNNEHYVLPGILTVTQSLSLAGAVVGLVVFGVWAWRPHRLVELPPLEP